MQIIIKCLKGLTFAWVQSLFGRYVDYHFTYIVYQYIATDLYIYSTIYCQSDIEIDGNRRTITGQHHVPVTTIMRMSDEKEKPKETINQKEPEKRKRVTTGNMEKPKLSNSSKAVC